MTKTNSAIDSSATTQSRPERRKKPRANMHDGIPVWYDCCSCEAEPYWTEGTEEVSDEINRERRNG